MPLYNFDLGVIRSEVWIMSNPQLSGPPS